MLRLVVILAVCPESIARRFQLVDSLVQVNDEQVLSNEGVYDMLVFPAGAFGSQPEWRFMNIDTHEISKLEYFNPAKPVTIRVFRWTTRPDSDRIPYNRNHGSLAWLAHGKIYGSYFFITHLKVDVKHLIFLQEVEREKLDSGYYAQMVRGRLHTNTYTAANLKAIGDVAVRVKRSFMPNYKQQSGMGIVAYLTHTAPQNERVLDKDNPDTAIKELFKNEKPMAEKTDEERVTAALGFSDRELTQFGLQLGDDGDSLWYSTPLFDEDLHTDSLVPLSDETMLRIRKFAVEGASRVYHRKDDAIFPKFPEEGSNQKARLQTYIEEVQEFQKMVNEYVAGDHDDGMDDSSMAAVGPKQFYGRPRSHRIFDDTSLTMNEGLRDLPELDPMNDFLHRELSSDSIQSVFGRELSHDSTQSD